MFFRYQMNGVHKTNIMNWNKKRKLQTDQVDLLRPKHKCWVSRFPSEHCLKFDENPELESMQYNLTVKGKTHASIIDNISEPGSVKDSNSFAEDSDTAMSVNVEAKLEIDCSKSYLYEDADVQALKNVEEQLLALGSCTEQEFLEHAKDSSEHSIDKEFEDFLYTSGVNPNMYVISSGRWNMNQGIYHLEL